MGAFCLLQSRGLASKPAFSGLLCFDVRFPSLEPCKSVISYIIIVHTR